jgi:hypothetical protein
LKRQEKTEKTGVLWLIQTFRDALEKGVKAGAPFRAEHGSHP